MELKAISKTYGADDKVVALDSVNIRIKPGKLICLIGPNGCGKSTLLKIIGGIESKTSGELTRPRKIAYLPQHDSLMPWLTIRRNLELPAKVEQKPYEELGKNIDFYLKKFNLTKFSNFYPHQLSGGMKQKVALIRAVLYQPDLILLDEPFSSLDSITRKQMQDWLESLWIINKPTIIFVTHDIHEAIRLADEIFVMSKRPSRIVGNFKIDIKRPRTIENINTGNSLRVQSKLMEILQDEST